MKSQGPVNVKVVNIGDGILMPTFHFLNAFQFLLDAFRLPEVEDQNDKKAVKRREDEYLGLLADAYGHMIIGAWPGVTRNAGMMWCFLDAHSATDFEYNAVRLRALMR